METKEEQSGETVVKPWGRVLVPPLGIHITISLNWSAETETHPRWEKLSSVHKQVDARLVRTRRLMRLISDYITTDQSEEYS